MPWYVIYSQPRKEKKVFEGLQRIGMEVYCPLVEQVRQWSDRKKVVKVPLFNSYIFVKCEEKEREMAFHVNGVVRYLFWLGKPAIVREEEMTALQNALKNTIAAVEVSGLQVGDVVQIPRGPFHGKEGIVKEVNKNSLRLVLSQLGVLITLTKAED